jgi:hypothetical protein
MKKIKITENQLNKIVKRILNEQGGFDDVNTMVLHNVRVHNEIGEIIDKLIFVIEQAHNALEQNLPKNKLLSGINKINNFLRQLKPDLKDLYENTYGDEYLKYALKEMSITVEQSQIDLSKLSHQQTGFHHPKFFNQSFGGGLGYDLNDEQLRSELFRIFDSIQKDALTLSEILIDSDEKNRKRSENMN